MKKQIISFIVGASFILGAMALVANASPVTPITGGGTQTSTIPADGNLLIGQGGKYVFISSSSLVSSESSSITINGVSSNIFTLNSSTYIGITTSGTAFIFTNLGVTSTANILPLFSSIAPIVYNSSTGVFSWTNSNGYISTSTGLTTANFATTSISQWNNDSNFISNTSISATSPITWSTSSVIACATCIATNTGNWAGTWQSTNSSTYFKVANNLSESTNTSTLRNNIGFTFGATSPITVATTSAGVTTYACSTCLTTSTFNITGTATNFPFWGAGGTSLTSTSSLTQNTTGTVFLDNLLSSTGTPMLSIGASMGINSTTFMSFSGAGAGRAAVGYDGANNSLDLQTAASKDIRTYVGGTFLGGGTLSMFIDGQVGKLGWIEIGGTAPAANFHVAGGFALTTASSTITTPSIGGAIVSGGCDSATSSVDSTLSSSTTSFITTPQNDPGTTLGGTWAYSLITSAGILTTRVCSNVSVTPATTAYVVKIIR